MSEHPLDRLARRLAAPDGVSRRRFLAGSAAVAASTALPLRFADVALAGAGAVTSCNCSGYADHTYLDCWDDIVDSAGPYNDSDGAVAAIQFGITTRFAQYACEPSADKAQAACTQVPCPADEMCITPPMGEPECGQKCVDRVCRSSEMCCNGKCVDANMNCGKCGKACVYPAVCQDHKCVTLCGGSVCPRGQACCNNSCIPAINATCCGSALGPDLCPLYSNQEGFPGTACTDVTCDAGNCGACGHQCGSNSQGAGGVCQCGQCMYGPYEPVCGNNCSG
jgi:hypothetical protein